MKEFVKFISNKETYNAIFAKPKPTVETRKDWYEKFYGDYGLFAIKAEDGIFKLTFGVDGRERETRISAEDLAERVYLYDRLELEGLAMISINAEKLLPGMKQGKDIDGHYIVVTEENRDAVNAALDKFAETDRTSKHPDPNLARANRDEMLILETFL